MYDEQHNMVIYRGKISKTLNELLSVRNINKKPQSFSGIRLM